MKQSGAVADMRREQMCGAQPAEPVVSKVEFAVDSAVHHAFEFQGARVDTVAGKNLFSETAAAGNRCALDNCHIVLGGGQVGGTNQAVVPGSNDYRARHENSERLAALASRRAASRTWGTIDR